MIIFSELDYVIFQIPYKPNNLPFFIVKNGFDTYAQFEEDEVDLNGYTPWFCIDIVSFSSDEMKNTTAIII